MAQARNIPIRDGDSAQGLSLRVIDNPQPVRKPLGLTALQQSHAALVAGVATLKPPVLPMVPDAEEVRAFDEYLVALAKVVDNHLAAVGRELSGAVIGVDRSQFEGVLFGAIDGAALFEVSEAATAVEEGTEIRTGMWGGE